MRTTWVAPVVLVLALAACAGARADSGEPRGAPDGAAITHEFAKALFDRMAPLRQSDGCVLSRFDTSRFRIVAGLKTGSGDDLPFEFASGSLWSDGGRRIGGWILVVPDQLDRECAATIAAIEHILRETPAPQGMAWEAGQLTVVQLNQFLLAASFVLLVLGTVYVLVREVRIHRPPAGAVLALAVLWLSALAIRSALSPRTFLHEYYHIAETITAYLTGNNPPTYGNAGPVIYRFVGVLIGRPYDVDVIFLTNLVLASLAVPAIALLDLAICGRWTRAICTGVLLCVLPHHIRFSASEVLFIPAITFALWSLALAMLYLRTRSTVDALLCVAALSLAMQTRPELMFFPAALLALVVLVEPRSWAVSFEWRTWTAFAVLAVLLSSRLLQLSQVLGEGSSPAPQLLGWRQFVESLVLLDQRVTPWVCLPLLVLGAAWALRHKPGLLVWSALVYAGYTLFSLSLFSNPPYNVRSQLLPTTFLMLVAGGVASLWTDLWGRRRRWAFGLGAPLLLVLAAGIALQGKAFITELRDQQLEWAFLRANVPALPAQGRLLAAVDIGGRNLNAFPDYLLRTNDKKYAPFDVRKAAAEQIAWPEAGEDLVYYQGMYCYFAFGNEPSPDPMTAACRAVHDRYEARPIAVVDLDTTGYSAMQYAHGPYRIGFYRLHALRDRAVH